MTLIKYFNVWIFKLLRKAILKLIKLYSLIISLEKWKNKSKGIQMLSDCLKSLINLE